MCCTVLYASGSYSERGQQISAPLYIDTWCLCKYIVMLVAPHAGQAISLVVATKKNNCQLICIMWKKSSLGTQAFPVYIARAGAECNCEWANSAKNRKAWA